MPCALLFPSTPVPQPPMFEGKEGGAAQKDGTYAVASLYAYCRAERKMRHRRESPFVSRSKQGAGGGRGICGRLGHFGEMPDKRAFGCTQRGCDSKAACTGMGCYAGVSVNAGGTALPELMAAAARDCGGGNRDSRNRSSGSPALAENRDSGSPAAPAAQGPHANVPMRREGHGTLGEAGRLRRRGGGGCMGDADGGSRGQKEAPAVVGPGQLS